MKTVESPGEKFNRQGGKPQARLCDAGGIQTLLQKFMQSGWVAQKQ